MNTFDPSEVIMSIYTVYFQPDTDECPFRVREFFIMKGGRTYLGPVRGVSPSLEGVRRYIPSHAAVRMERNDPDAPEFLESWL